MKVSPARAAAFDILLRIETEHAFSSVLLPKYENRLSGPDRGLCHEIVLGVLRRQMYLDAIIEKLAGTKKLDIEVRIAIRIGLYQLLYLDRVPAHAAVDESVELAARARKTSARPLVNAVLRRNQREAVELSFKDYIERVSVETSHPRWLVERWGRQFGFEAATAICEANNRQRAVAFRPLDTKVAETFADADIEELRAAAEQGQVYFQDRGSQMIGEYVAQIPGDAVIDLCAAPGGKTLIIAEGDRSIVIAGDHYDTRVRLLQETCARLAPGKVLIVQYDAEVPLPFVPRGFDVVFVDAPCSGTGTIAHNPEIRYFVSEGRIAEASRKQLSILQNASELVRPGGTLVYSTCSLETDENEGVCELFQRGNGDFVAAVPRLDDVFVRENGFVRIFPHIHSADGYFVAEFRRM